METRTKILTHVLAAVLLALCFVLVAATFGVGSRVYGFLFERGVVQVAILYVFVVAMVLLARRATAHLRGRKAFGGHGQREPGGDSAEGRRLSDRVTQVRRVLVSAGGAASLRCARETSRDESEAIADYYEVIDFIASVLVGLGLFGTVLGLSNSLFQAFSSGGESGHAVQMFVAALSTALDTTVLGLMTAGVVSVSGRMLERSEMARSDANDQWVRGALHLDELEESLARASEGVPGTPRASDQEIARAELRAIAASVADGATTRFAEFIEDMADAHRAALATIAAETAAHSRREEELVENRRWQEEVLEGLTAIREILGSQGDGLTDAIKREIEGLEKSLHETRPTEVVLKYHSVQHPDEEASRAAA
jgi:biopolymer transport protein ExbB/TolQ